MTTFYPITKSRLAAKPIPRVTSQYWRRNPERDGSPGSGTKHFGTDIMWDRTNADELIVGRYEPSAGPKMGKYFTPSDAKLVSPIAGKVSYTNTGNGVQYIYGDKGFYVRFGHAAELWKETGDTVKAGEIIGLPGKKGGTNVVHIHFSTKQDLNWPNKPSKFVYTDPNDLLEMGIEQGGYRDPDTAPAPIANPEDKPPPGEDKGGSGWLLAILALILLSRR